MQPIVTRCQVAKNIWLLCSEHTSTLPPVEVIGVTEVSPDGAIIVHFLATEDDVRCARKDMMSAGQLVVAACVGRDEDMYPTPGTVRMIGELRSEFGEGNIFHCPEALFDWVRRQLTPVAA